LYALGLNLGNQRDKIEGGVKWEAAHLAGREFGHEQVPFDFYMGALVEATPLPRLTALDATRRRVGL
jgi:hypothetical protein